jgi:hypothetical protein
LRRDGMKVLYWGLLAVGVALIVFAFVGDNVRWLNFVGVAVVLVGGAFNPKRPFYGLRKQQ